MCFGHLHINTNVIELKLTIFFVVVFYFCCLFFVLFPLYFCGFFEYLKFHFISTISFLYLFVIFLVIALGFTVYMHTCVLNHVWLFETWWTVTHPTPLSMRFPRQEYWGRLPFPSGVFLTQGLNPCLPHWQVGSLPWATRDTRGTVWTFLYFCASKRLSVPLPSPSSRNLLISRWCLLVWGQEIGRVFSVVLVQLPALWPWAMVERLFQWSCWSHRGRGFFSFILSLAQVGPHMCLVGDRTHWPIPRPLKLLLCREEGLG